MLNIIISGAPGCGKGTQSELIIKKYELKHFSTGELLRNEMRAKTPLGLEAEAFIAKGNLVPDEMIINILREVFEQIPADAKGLILDGFPRTLAQAEALEEMMDNMGKPITMMIDLDVPDKELISRLITRGETSGRSDDNLDTIKKRLEVYEQKTAPVSNFYKSLNKHFSIDGTGSVEEIFSRIEAVID